MTEPTNEQRKAAKKFCPIENHFIGRTCYSCEEIVMRLAARDAEVAARELDHMISIMESRQKEVYDLTIDAWICGLKGRRANLSRDPKPCAACQEDPELYEIRPCDHAEKKASA